MGSKVLSDVVEWEARRVAAAFGIDDWAAFYPGFASAQSAHFAGMAVDGEWVEWGIRDNRIDEVFVGKRADKYEYCYFSQLYFNNRTTYSCRPHPNYNRLMARGLYRLGFEDEGVIAKLNHPLTAHEKLELRLSLPREFWPQKWLDEEAANIENRP